MTVGKAILYLLQLSALRGPQSWVKYARQHVVSWCRDTSRNRIHRRARSNWLLVDVSIFAMHDAGTGIQRVVRSIAVELLRDPPPDFEVRLIRATRKNRYRHVIIESLSSNDHGLQLMSSSLPVEVQSGDVFLGLDFSSRIIPSRVRELLAWKKSGVKLAFVVYDLLPAIHPEWFTKKGKKHYQIWLRSIAINADMFCCISNSVADELRQWMVSKFGIPIDEKLIRWFHLGTSFDSLHPEPVASVTASLNAGHLALNRTILMVGTVEPRKGHEQVLLALETLWRQGSDITLVIAGRQGWNVDELAVRLRQHVVDGARVIWLEDVNDRQLIWLYQTLGTLVMASQAEGFGLPLVEALHYGMPILARDIAVFREICGESVMYFSGACPAQLADRILVRLEAGRSNTKPLASLEWRASTAWLLQHLESLAS